MGTVGRGVRWLGALALGLLLVPAAPARAAEGGESAEAAAKGFLQAWKDKDVAKIKTFLLEKDRAEADQVLAITEIKEFAVGNVKVQGSEGSRSATAEFTWKMVLDADKMKAMIIEQATKEAAERGLSEQEKQQQVAMLEAMLPGMLPMMKQHFEKERHVMTLVEKEGRWFVKEPLEAPDGMGGEQPQEHPEGEE